MSRVVFRELFRLQDKRIDVFFYTSNLVKFLHAHTVFSRLGLKLSHWKSKSDPYSEDYSGTKQQLLARAIDQIKDSIGSGSLFFVEDTSVRIDALSQGAEDFPGLSVKEWFARTSFRQLDSQLKDLGAGRRASIHSSIALHVPKLSNPIYFEGSVGGVVTKTPPRFEENFQYPWLTPNSFNGWFVPDGAEKRLGEMPFEESWNYDFRTQALVRLVDRLEEFQAVLNLPPHAYTRALPVTLPEQATLFPTFSQPTFMVVGYTCAGKTTFGDVATRAGFTFIEASSILRTFQVEGGSTLSPFEFAQRVLEANGPDAVAHKIAQLCAREDGRGIVISGFRTLEEVQLIKRRYPNSKVVWIEASEKSRYARFIARSRDDGLPSLHAFRELDTMQSSFGLLRVAEAFADIRILNEDTLEKFGQQVEAVLNIRRLRAIAGVVTNVKPLHAAEHSQLYHCLVVLNESKRPLTCDEIQERTKRHGHEIRYNNANKVLRKALGLVKRWEIPGAKIRYEIVNSGRAYLRLIEELSSSNGISGPKRKKRASADKG